MPLPFSLEEVPLPDRVVLRVRGEVDLASSPVLTDAFDRALASDVELVVADLGGVEFMDSSGLRALILARERLEGLHRRLILHDVRPQVRRLLEVTGLDDRFELETPPDEP